MTRGEKNELCVILADDHTLVRSGLRSLLEHIDGFSVIGEAADGQQALEQVKNLQPDLVIMDIAMPRLNGLDATARILNRYPETRVLILSMHSNEEYAVQALSAGASGYILKDSAVEDLENALRSVVGGDVFLSPKVSAGVVRRLCGREGTEARQVTLTSRQREVLQLIAEGHSSRDIANLLSVSAKTVETHRSRLMQRLNIFDVPSLTRYAIKTGLISEDY